MAKVKGVLFTVGLMILSLVVLSLALVLFSSFQKSELTMSEIGALDRAYNLDMSIQNVLKNLFDSSSGIDIEIDNTDNFISFEENLPSTRGAVFNLTVKNFKNFTESNFDYVNLDIDRILKELPLIVLPYNIEYKHMDFGERTIEIIPESMNFNKYEVSLTLSDTITSCPAMYDEITDFDVYVQASSPGMECLSRKIEPDIENRISTENGFIYLMADLDGRLVVMANDTSTKIKTKIWLNPLDDIGVQYPTGIIYINLTDIGISKTNTVKIR